MNYGSAAKNIFVKVPTEKNHEDGKGKYNELIAVKDKAG